MKKENCEHFVEWDYLQHKEIKNNITDYQLDWNQTLLTKINMIASQIRRSSRRYGPDTIEVSPKLEPLIETLQFYNKETKQLGSKYNIKINDEIEDNTMFLYHSDEDIVVIPFITEEPTDGGFSEIVFKPINVCSEDKVSKYKKSIKGYITIKNY
jgi:hypothetical protein